MATKKPSAGLRRTARHGGRDRRGSYCFLAQHAGLLFGQQEAAALPLVQDEQSFLVAQEASTREAETKARERRRVMR